jgi:hypothetical protein
MLGELEQVGFLVAFGAVVLVGCSGDSTPQSTGGQGGGGSTSVGAGGSAGGCSSAPFCDPSKWSTCTSTPVAMTDCSDFDSDGSPTGILCVMPGGSWSVDVDTADAGTAKDDSWKIEPCGTTGNGFHFHGTGHSVWGADAAAAMVNATTPVDVSAYSGLSFVMKSMTATSVIFKAQNAYSQPACGQCDDLVKDRECYSGYTKTVALPAMDATPIVVKWNDLAQQGWGYRPAGTKAFDPRSLVSLAFAFDRSVDFDVCLDDVKLVK